jgi:hypothetical protein
MNVTRAVLPVMPKQRLGHIATAEQKVADLKAQIDAERDLSTSLAFDREWTQIDWRGNSVESNRRRPVRLML